MNLARRSEPNSPELACSPRQRRLRGAIGLLISVAGSFVLRSYLFGLSPLDPIAYLGVSLLLALAGGLATVIPSRRALAVDPALTLKAE